MDRVVSNSLLDLRLGIGQVACTFRWDILDAAGNPLGQIHPERGAQISNNTGSAVFRSISNVQIRESEARDIDFFRTFVRPYMVLEDGTEWSLGVFSFSVDSYTEGTLETPLTTSLLDLRFFLGQIMPHSFGISDGGSVHEAMKEIAGIYGLPTDGISPTNARIGGGPVNWPPDITGIQILESLAQRAGFYSPYFDNNGLLILRPVDELLPGVGHQYNRKDGRIEVNTLGRTSNLLTAPNAYKVLSSGPTVGEVYAVAYINPQLEWSRERRGFTVTKVIRRQGLASSQACMTVAKSYARQDAGQTSTIEFTSVADPRHDTFDLVEIDGAVYLETGGSMKMEPGGTHTHSLVSGVLSDDYG